MQADSTNLKGAYILYASKDILLVERFHNEISCLWRKSIQAPQGCISMKKGDANREKEHCHKTSLGDCSWDDRTSTQTRVSTSSSCLFRIQ